MDEIVFFTVDAGEDRRPARSSDVAAEGSLKSARVRDRPATTVPGHRERKPLTRPGYIRLYEMAADMRERRHDAQQRAEQYRQLRDSVELRTSSVHRNKRAGDVRREDMVT